MKPWEAHMGKWGWLGFAVFGVLPGVGAGDASAQNAT